MARPTVLHKGFLIPNAGDVASPQMSEPDRIDFNTLGNARFGVIEGCEITVSGSTAMNTPGTAIVDGKLVPMAGGQSASLGAAGTQDRYDLLTVNTGGILTVTPGTAAADPVFPDPPTTATVLAAVFCPAGAGSLVDNVIDKRKMLSDSLLTKIGPSASLVANRNGTGDLFKIDGSGTTVWNNDTVIQRIAAKTLKVTENIQLDGYLAAGGALTATSLTTTGKVQSSNLRTGADNPNGPPSALLGNPGDLYQQTSGKLYIHSAGTWKELATVESAIPIGTVITSLVAPASIGAGWVPLDGQTVINESVNASLFNIPALNSYINPGGTVGTRQMTMPNATQRVLMGDFTTAGTRGGGLNNKNQFVVNLANLPPHKHNVLTLLNGAFDPVARTGPSGRHTHLTVTGGAHGHDVTDPGHKHYWAEAPAGGAFVALSWNGQNKIDAYFNDRSHTYSVESADWTGGSFTNIKVTTMGSEHDHIIAPADDHLHSVTIDHVDAHKHTVTEDSIGSGQPIDYTPMYLSVYVYIRQ